MFKVHKIWDTIFFVVFEIKKVEMLAQNRNEIVIWVSAAGWSTKILNSRTQWRIEQKVKLLQTHVS
jgi:hypothetical protein